MINKTLFITGSDGFIGRNLKEYFGNQIGLTVLSPTLQELDLTHSEDVSNYIRKYSPTWIIHSATVIQSNKEYEASVLEKNLRMFFNLYRSKGRDTLMVNLGSGSEYSRPHWKSNMDETYFDCHVPDDAHSFSKYVMANFIKHASTENIVHLRLFGVFGKYEDYRYKFVSNTIAKNLLGLPIVINKNAVYDYLFIDDFCRIVENIIKRKSKEALFNVVPRNSTDLLTIAKIVNNIAKKTVNVTIINSGYGREYTGSSKTLLENFSNIKFTPLKDSISYLYDYYSTRTHSLDKRAIQEDQFLNYAKKLNS